MGEVAVLLAQILICVDFSFQLSEFPLFNCDWWQHEEGVIAFQNEVIKYLYYRFKY